MLALQILIYRWLHNRASLKREVLYARWVAAGFSRRGLEIHAELREAGARRDHYRRQLQDLRIRQCRGRRGRI